MAESADDPALFWVEPRERGIIPLDGFHVPQRLARTVRVGRVRDPHRPRFRRRDRRLRRRRRRDRRQDLDQRAHPPALRRAVRPRPCHTVEAWRDGRLVGGLYGVRPRARRSSARACSTASATPRRSPSSTWSARLRAGGFRLLDTQFVTEHLAQFGAVEVPRQAYKRSLREADRRPGRLACVAARADRERGRGPAGARKGDALLAVGPRSMPTDRRRSGDWSGRSAAVGCCCGCTGTPRSGATSSRPSLVGDCRGIRLRRLRGLAAAAVALAPGRRRDLVGVLRPRR